MVCNRVYSAHEVNRAIKSYVALKSFRKAEKATNIPKSSINRWYRKFGEQGISRRTLKRTTQKRRSNKLEAISKLLDTGKSNTTIGHLQHELSKQGMATTQSNISKMLKCMQYLRKKERVRQKYCCAKQHEDRTKEFIEKTKGIRLDEVISVDETGMMSMCIGPRYGYFKRGVSAPVHVKHKYKYDKQSCCMAITTKGVLMHEVLDHNYHKADFIEFFTKLMELNAGYKYVLMDNISFHHSHEVKELAKQNNIQLLYPPPYSPEFNPIEIAFSQLKRIFRDKLYQNIPFKRAVTDSLTRLCTRTSFVAEFRHSLPHV